MPTITVTMNKEMNGIEIRFDSKPAAEVLTSLRDNGFRWSNRQKMWYARQNKERIAFADSLNNGKPAIVSNKAANQEDKCSYSLWDATRTDGIENNFEKFHLYSTKEIACRIRKHIRARFPMIDWSVRSTRNSIYVKAVRGPYAIDSDEAKAIAHYVYKYAHSYNYDHSDLMTDYFDVNFYGVYEHDIFSKYDYTQNNPSEHESKEIAAFQAAKAAFEKAEKERKAKEAIELAEKAKQEAAERKRLDEIRKENHDEIEAAAQTKEVSYFVTNCVAPKEYKADNLELYNASLNEDGERRRITCKITREVYLPADLMTVFSKALLDDYSFLVGCGGTATDDYRINSDTDFRHMSHDERLTVEWYCNDCVAVVADGKIAYIINPEGHGYAREVYLLDELSERVNEYTTANSVDPNKAENEKAVEQIGNLSADVICNGNMEQTWDSTDRQKYRKAMVAGIREKHIPFNVNIVRAIKNTYLKDSMYNILEVPDDVQEQFANCGLTYGEQITIVRITSLGGVSVQHAQFKSFEFGKYAQHDKAVKLVFRPADRRSDYLMWIYDDVLIYRGYVEIPRSLFYDTSYTADGVRVSKSKYLSHDKAQYDVVIDYLKNNGAMPVINTYKPIF